MPTNRIRRVTAAEESRSHNSREDALAHAGHRIADAIEMAVERLGPAADTVHGFGERLDKLCAWLRGKKPWIIGIIALLIGRTINAAPEDVPRLINSVATAVRMATGG